MTEYEAARLDALSPRQKEILRLLGRQLQQKEVARLLGISPWTVRDHIVEAREKLQVERTRDAVLLLMDHEAPHLPPAEWGPLTQGIGEIEENAAGEGHEQARSTTSATSADASRSSLGGSGRSPASPGAATAAEGRGRHDRRLQSAAGLPRAEASHDHRVGDRLADGRKRHAGRWLRRLQVFERNLKGSNLVQLAAMTGVLVVLAALVIGVLIIGIVGTLASLQAFFHPVR